MAQILIIIFMVTPLRFKSGSKSTRVVFEPYKIQKKENRKIDVCINRFL